uniref:Uncharacterized protein n=1 Tax=Rhizophora mucronata TaxID=61149 RepID=A0A2P2N5H3_RHIMU
MFRANSIHLNMRPGSINLFYVVRCLVLASE